MAIAFHKDLPIPKRTTSRSTKYPFESLTEVGHSFVEDEVIDAAKVANRLTAAVGNYRRRIGEDAPKFSVRVIQIAGKDAVGVWRL